MQAKSVLNVLYIVTGFLLAMSVTFIEMAFDKASQQAHQLISFNELASISTELKRSSDLLTQFARMYAVTADDKWLTLFNHVIDVRTGFAPPVNNVATYWDALSLLAKESVPKRSEQKRWKSIIERFQSTGANLKETNELKSALNSSDELIKIEQKAFELIESGDEKSLYIAQAMLFGDDYLREKNKIMTSVGQALSEVNERKVIELNSSSLRIEYAHLYSNVSLACLCFIFFSSYWLLRERYFNPIRQVHDAVLGSIKRNNYQIELPKAISGELGELIDAFQLIFKKLTIKINTSKLVKEFSLAIRGVHLPKDIIEKSLLFISLRFDSPSCAIFNLKDNKLALHDFIGHPPIFDEHSAHAKALVETLTLQTLTALDDNKIQLTINGQELLINQAYIIPLMVSDQCIGGLYVATPFTYHQTQLDTLEEICNDLAIAIQLGASIEKQNAVESALSEQLELTHHIINAIPNPTYYRNINGDFMGVNKAFLNFIDKFEAEVIDYSLEEIFDANAATVFGEKACQIITQQVSVEYDLTTTNGLGEYVELEIHEAPFFNNQSHVAGVVGMFLDVTKRNELERELLEAKHTADRSAKVKGEFLANMSHEIRTPMNAIIGMAHLALASNLDEKQHNYVNKIDIAAKQLLRLINDILDFSKIEAGKIDIESTPFKLDKLLETVATVVSIKAEEKGLELVFDTSPILPNYFIGDLLRLSQVLINLVGNAVKFTEQGSVTIKIMADIITDENYELKFSVKDTGIGMSKEQQKKLFQSFSQADSSITRKYGGTGLGLTISQELVKLMGGEIRVESSQGEGSEFYFEITLPINHEAQEHCGSMVFTRQYNVLIIDDNLEALEVLENTLTNMGLTVTSIDNAKAAIALLKHKKVQFDLLIIDWQMPELDGLGALETLKTTDLVSNTKVMLTTAYGRELELNDAQKSLIDGVILKPLNPSYLFDSIAACMETYRPVSNKKMAANSTKILKGIKILLVEDQPVNQEIATEILFSFGAIIEVANNGQEAIEMLKNFTYDMVLMDMQMPILDGISATKIIRETYSSSELPILAMTANAMREDILLCKEVGMNGHIAKPINIDIMVSEIIQHLNIKSVISETQQIESKVEYEQAERFNEGVMAINKSLEGINLAEGIERAAGSESAYFRILSKFLSHQVEELINLKQAIAIKNYELAGSILHAFKGAAANLSVSFLVDKAKHMESSLRLQNIEDKEIDTLIDYVKKTHNRCLEIIKINTAPAYEVDSVDGQMTIINELEQALLDFDTSATELMLKLHPSEKLSEEDLNTLNQLLSGFDFSGAHAFLTQRLAV